MTVHHARRILLHLANQQAPVSFLIRKQSTGENSIDIDPCFFRDLSKHMNICDSVSIAQTYKAINETCKWKKYTNISEEHKKFLSESLIELFEATNV